MIRKSIKVDIKSTTTSEIEDNNAEDKAFLRFFYKPCDGGTLWAYNKKTLSFRSFGEIPGVGGLGTQVND